MKPCIIIPAYRAARTLLPTLERIPEDFFAAKGLVVIVDDACPEETGRVADELAGSHAGVVVEHHVRNKGYGGAQKTGLKRGLVEGCGAFAVVHADGQYAPELVLRLLEPILSGQAEIVQGSRMLGGGALKGGMPLSRYLANRTLTLLENLCVGTSLAEFHSGYMLYSRRMLESVPFEALRNNYNFDAEMIILASLRGWKCHEIAIPTRYDDTTSSLAPIPYGLNVLKMMLDHLRGHYRKLLDSHAIGQARADLHPETLASH